MSSDLLSNLNIEEYFDEADFCSYIIFKNGGTKIRKEFLQDAISLVGYERVKAVLNKINDSYGSFILRCIGDETKEKYILIVELDC